VSWLGPSAQWSALCFFLIINNVTPAKPNIYQKPKSPARSLKPKRLLLLLLRRTAAVVLVLLVGT
jgi:hypothetical protein